MKRTVLAFAVAALTLAAASASQAAPIAPLPGAATQGNVTQVWWHHHHCGWWHHHHWHCW
jgi:hypothetical protein